MSFLCNPAIQFSHHYPYLLRDTNELYVFCCKCERWSDWVLEWLCFPVIYSQGIGTVPPRLVWQNIWHHTEERSQDHEFTPFVSYLIQLLCVQYRISLSTIATNLKFGVFTAERNVFRPIVFLIFYERPCLVFQNSKQNQLGVVIMDVVG